MSEPNERPPIAHASLTAVLPVCNAEADLAGIVDGRNSYLDSLIRDYGLRLKGADCAFMLFRGSIFARIPIQSDGSFVHTEILAKANFLGCLIAEADVRYSPRADSGVDIAARRQRRREALRLFRHPDF